MEFTPDLILEKYQRNELDRTSAKEFLVSFIENSDDEQVRINSIRILNDINVCDTDIFHLLENLLISDASFRVREAAIKYIFQKFQEKAFPIIHWVLDHEKEYFCYTVIVQSLAKIQHEKAKLLLLQEINKIRKKKYLFDDKRITNRAFQKELKNLLKSRELDDLSHEELAEIIINFRTILILKEKFYSVYYELENAMVITLDLSDVEFEVRGWKSEFKNEISNLSEITGLKNLKKLKKLYLSNNQISDIKELLELKNLTHLYISKNWIKDLRNIEYIKQMVNLQFLDISENLIVTHLKKENFPFVVKLNDRTQF